MPTCATSGSDGTLPSPRPRHTPARSRSTCVVRGHRAGLAGGRGPDAVVRAVAAPRHLATRGVAGAVGSAAVRGPRRINCVLAGVREFLAFAVDHGHAPTTVLGHLYELADSRDLPAEARGEDGAWRLRLKPAIGYRWHGNGPTAPVTRCRRLLRACRSARDRLLVLLLARAGLRRGELVGLRREDLHFLIDASSLGCSFPGSHLHVVRRPNSNGAWAKSRHSRGPGRSAGGAGSRPLRHRTGRRLAARLRATSCS